MSSEIRAGHALYTAAATPRRREVSFKVHFDVVNNATGQRVATHAPSATVMDGGFGYYSRHVDIGMLEVHPHLAYGGREYQAAKSQATALTAARCEPHSVTFRWEKIERDVCPTGGC